MVLAFFVPVILFAQLSALLDRLGEHEWLAPRPPGLGRYFAAARSAAGITEESIALTGGATVADALRVMCGAHGTGLARVLDRCSYLLDEVAVDFLGVEALALKVKAVLRAMTKLPRMRESSVVRFSVTPSAK